MKTNQKAFTLVELIVVITILAILATIAFVSFTWYQLQARDSTRVSDINNISKVIDLFELQNSTLPQVTNPISVTFSGSTIWQQGSFWVNSRQDSRRISDIPTDPLTWNEYAYSVTSSSREYQLGAILEWSLSFNNRLNIEQSYANNFIDFSSVYIRWTYNGRFLIHREVIDENNETIYILGVPSILSIDNSNVTIESILTNNWLLYPWKRIAPSTYSGSVSRDEDWNFTPQITSYGTANSSLAVVFEGTTSELSSGSWKIDLVDSLRTYYASSDLVDDENIDDFNIDTSSNPNDAINLINTYILGNLWGLENSSVSVSKITSWTSWWWSWGWSWPASCGDMTAGNLANLNAWANVDIVTDNRWNPIPPEWTAMSWTSSHGISDWCSLTLLDMSFWGFPNIIDELGLLENLTVLYIFDDSVSSLPETLVDLTALEELDLWNNPALWNLNNYFDTSSPRTCQAWVTTSGNTMCLEWNGSNLMITVE